MMKNSPDKHLQNNSLRAPGYKPHGKHIRWLSGCLIFLCISCHSTNPPEADDHQQQQAWKDTIHAAIPLIRQGDLVLRTGNDFTSETFRKMMQRDQRYSHCGLASWEHGKLFIYHAIGGSWNPDQTLRRDSFPLFADPEANRAFAIYRFMDTDTLMGSVLQKARTLFLQHIPFDMEFSLESNDRMYCAEFVWKCLESGSNGALQFPLSEIMQRKFIGIDDLFLHPKAKLIYSYRYQ